MPTCAYRNPRHACSLAAEPGSDRCFWHQAVEAPRTFPPDLARTLEDRVHRGEPIEGFMLFGAPLPGARLGSAQAAEARLDGANLSASHLEAATLLSAYLIAADLRDANLRRAQLKFANLRQADLTGADLTEAVLRVCEMPQARLAGARLERTDLGGADLRGADLRNADLSGASLKGADLTGARFEGATLAGVLFDGGTLFDEAEGLDQAFEVPESLCQRLGIRRRPAAAPRPTQPAPAVPPVPAPSPQPKLSLAATKPPAVPAAPKTLRPPAPVPPPAPPPDAPPAAARPAPEAAPRPAGPPAAEPTAHRPLQKLEGQALWEELICGEPDRIENAAAQLDKKARAHYAARLVPLVLGSDPARAIAAAEALAHLPEPGVARELLQALIRGDEATCTNAAFVFRKWAVPVLEAPLLKLLGKLDPPRKANVLWILEEVGRQDSVAPIEDLLRDPSEDVRAAAESALERVRERLAQTG
jgi:uncharacterized protein YjbI with pentapeptide repeats